MAEEEQKRLAEEITKQVGVLNGLLSKAMLKQLKVEVKVREMAIVGWPFPSLHLSAQIYCFLSETGGRHIYDFGHRP